MNVMGKISGSEDDQKQENQQEQTPTIGPLLSSSSYHHHPHHHQSFFSPPSYNQHHNSWLQDGGKPSSTVQDEGGWNMVVEREHMFDKVVTPSDVGKLNRLVIPKQHAERFFPLDSSTNYKGLLLNFEDRNGKLWRFQYSYWNSSQSYVMTKGWSRFVKEKKLDAGDIVSFQRGVGVTGKDRLFIDWRRRVNPSTPLHQLSSSSSHDLSYLLHNNNFIHPWNPLVLQSFPARRNPNYFMLQDPNTNVNPNHSGSRSVYFGSGGYGLSHQQLKMVQRSELGLGFDAAPPAAGSMVDHGKGSGKRLRLFGVNMDCVFSDDEDDDHSSELMENTTVGGCSSTVVNPLIPSSSSSSSSFSTIPYLQLTPNGGESECNQSTMLSSSSSTTHDFSIVSRSTVSNMCLDLKMSQTDE